MATVASHQHHPAAAANDAASSAHGMPQTEQPSSGSGQQRQLSGAQPATSTPTHTHSHTHSHTQAHAQTHTHTHSIQLVHSVAATGLPHGLGLLTTVASLPPKYRSRYLNLKTKCEIPLDLSVKLPSPSPTPTPTATPVATPQPEQMSQIAEDVPMANAYAEVHTAAGGAVAATAESAARISPQPASDSAMPMAMHSPALVVAHEEVVAMQAKPATPPQSPAKRKFFKLDQASETTNSNSNSSSGSSSSSCGSTSNTQPAKIARDETPAKPIRTAEAAPRTTKSSGNGTKPTRNKATRKLKFDEETSSPVSGTIIRPLEDITGGTVQYSNGDIDPKYNIVEITEETKAELAAIKNVIGDFVCKLCRIKFEDAFGLAQHRCACIVLLEYRCPECGKQFNCPANLASHRRWHKPRKEAASSAAANSKKENRNTINQQQQPAATAASASAAAKKSDSELPFDCGECGKRFKRQAYLRKHQQTHAKRGAQTTQRAQPAQPAQAATTLQSEVQAQSSSSSSSPAQQLAAATTTITGSFQTTPYKSISSSSASSSHSYADEGVYVAGATGSHCEDEADYMSDCSSSSSSAGYGRLQIVEHGFTEEESIAAAALTNLRNCASVIQHTTLAH